MTLRSKSNSKSRSGDHHPACGNDFDNVLKLIKL